MRLGTERRKPRLDLVGQLAVDAQARVGGPGLQGRARDLVLSPVREQGAYQPVPRPAGSSLEHAHEARDGCLGARADGLQRGYDPTPVRRQHPHPRVVVLLRNPLGKLAVQRLDQLFQCGCCSFAQRLELVDGLAGHFEVRIQELLAKRADLGVALGVDGSARQQQADAQGQPLQHGTARSRHHLRMMTATRAPFDAEGRSAGNSCPRTRLSP